MLVYIIDAIRQTGNNESSYRYWFHKTIGLYVAWLF